MAEWGYDCRTFDSFDELQEAMPTVAKELADNYDTDDLVSIWVSPMLVNMRSTKSLMAGTQTTAWDLIPTVPQIFYSS